jgi:glycerol-3-phosphate dehydrogenase
VRSAGAIVIGGYINGLGLVRALAARKVATAVITTQPYDIAQRSRWSCASAASPT